ncbi:MULTISPECIES: M23 family metallopeptidase [Yersinia pseudotuberculosis complex]|nr:MULTISPECIES: M23 family metallopeptidase [Yersinia pseudotuberculosis complex]MCE4113315.1 M23 family metallopeptidase [Yersinia pseudotuberculosis]WLF06075.1 M23 family metallopeptidase [Yersinia pseudotuberculosis]
MNRKLKAGILVIGLYSINTAADTCMIPPTSGDIVSGRFGKDRGGGAENHGSANQKPHMHDGLDFSTSGISQPVYAPSDATVVYSGARGTAGNAVLMQRPNGDIISFYHLSALNVKMGDKINAGKQVGISGNTPSTSMVKHLHVSYGTSDKNEARAKAFNTSAFRGAFEPATLSNSVKFQAGIGYKTDPSPHFCETFPIKDGHPEDAKYLGADTKAQYQILFGSVPEGGTPPNSNMFDDVQVAAGNTDALAAQQSGLSTAEYASDNDGYGALPEPPMGKYSSMSASEMIQTEAMRRFTDGNWNTELTRVTSRALIVDYVRAEGLSNYLSNEILKKKEKVEALLAVYTSQKMSSIKENVQRDGQAAIRSNAGNLITK